MELAVANIFRKSRVSAKKVKVVDGQPNLTQADINSPYIIKGIDAKEDGIKEFLFTLGCYEGETVTVISVLAENYVINIKDARYSIDEDLAKTIRV
ncbi:MAG: FeoA family protein [Bacillota bacterium]|nr:ferrous iron transport protein A [Bacillota bacterium]MDW7729892.1 FeoA family protein [Bacillota bacterium]